MTFSHENILEGLHDGQTDRQTDRQVDIVYRLLTIAAIRPVPAERKET